MSPPRTAATAAALPLAGARVLVAEDEAVVALDLAMTLGALGCTVLGPAPSAATALALLGRERPDAALVDLGLRDGLAAGLVAALAAAGVPLVLLLAPLPAAGPGGPPPLPRAAARLEKPYAAAELRRALARLLSPPPAPA